jgi:hypothetical protein
MKIQMLIVSFVMLSALFIISNNNLHVQNTGERAVFGNAYYGWLGSVFDNFKTITGDVINARWLPENNKTQNANISNESNDSAVLAESDYSNDSNVSHSNGSTTTGKVSLSVLR